MKITLILLSVLDLVFTSILLETCGEAMELNPLAAYLYRHGGLLGILSLKVGTLALALGIIEVIEAAGRPCTAFGLTLFACVANLVAVLLGVFCYAKL